MKEVNIHEAKTNLSRLLARVSAGEEIIIAKAGKPVARLIPYKQAKKDRIPDLDKGLVEISEDFDAPLPEDLLKDFEA